MIKRNRKRLEQHLYIILKNDFNEVPAEYIEEYSAIIPTKFYKYRTFDETHLEAISNDYIWLSLAKDFPDGSDSTVKYDIKKQFNKIQKILNELLPEIIIKEIKKEYVKKYKVLPPVFKETNLDDIIMWIKEHAYKNGKFKYGKTRNYLKSKKLTERQIKTLENKCKHLTSEENKNNLAKKIIEHISSLNNNFRELYYIHSFSAEKDNSFLWDTYTNKDEGFCIEYDLKDEPDQLIKMLPIIYSPSAEIKMDELVKIGLQNKFGKPNKTENHEIAVNIFSHLLTKNKNYKTENEWRLIINKKTQSSNKYKFPFITAIYLGSKMKEEDRKRLINIATDKGIRVFQRQRDKFNTKYEFIELAYN